ncbi:hypothetical protein CTEN210_00323 [Chaetoceros tenuissimus]|uniref:Leucine-rich repeat domain-containing protein n=1 Tax=Chaetoceros tenuissimus TaxID=426638 RepID=A0AAD3GYQ3_9STRA|nr:hypothetical protein CTEN210_00323 [Chaetoceros tenuissimus]
MRVATVDGLVTLFYDGSKPLHNRELSIEWDEEEEETFYEYNKSPHWEDWNLSIECKRYFRERLSWEQVIIVDGVTEIPEFTFMRCWNIERVILADSVIEIKRLAFYECRCLFNIKWSINLACIGSSAFELYDLSDVFIPPRCREIKFDAFALNKNLEILNVPPDIDLGDFIFRETKLFQRSPFYRTDDFASLNNEVVLNLDTWLKNINNSDQFALHRVCSSFEPTLQMIVDVLKERGGPKAFQVENSIGITPSRYLEENPYAHVKEKEVIEKYVLQMMGEF